MWIIQIGKVRVAAWLNLLLLYGDCFKYMSNNEARWISVAEVLYQCGIAVKQTLNIGQ
jgi:hypothetical protein